MLVGRNYRTVLMSDVSGWNRQFFCGILGEGCRVAGQHLFNLRARIGPPVRRPDPVKRPTEALKLALPKAVTLASDDAGVVHGAIAFDGQNELTGLLWVADREVESVAPDAPLGLQAE